MLYVVYTVWLVKSKMKTGVIVTGQTKPQNVKLPFHTEEWK